MKKSVDTVKSKDRNFSVSLHLGKKLGDNRNEIKGNREMTIYLKLQMP
jgi:hypothetical protein